MSMTINHDDKLNLMLHQFLDSTIIRAFNKAFLDESNELENLCQDLYDDRNLDSAIGVQLDQIGLLIGQSRNGLDDDQYRNQIRIRIAINNSQGTVEDLIGVLNLLFGKDVDVIVNRSGKAELTLFIGISKPDDDLVPILEQTIPAGVKIVSILYPSDRLPWIPTERGGVTQDTGILPEIGDNSPTVRVPPERI